MPRIFVADDEPDICHMIRRYAEHDGYETVGVILRIPDPASAPFTRWLFKALLPQK